MVWYRGNRTLYYAIGYKGGCLEGLQGHWGGICRVQGTTGGTPGTLGLNLRGIGEEGGHEEQKEKEKEEVGDK